MPDSESEYPSMFLDWFREEPGIFDPLPQKSAFLSWFEEQPEIFDSLPKPPASASRRRSTKTQSQSVDVDSLETGQRLHLKGLGLDERMSMSRILDACSSADEITIIKQPSFTALAFTPMVGVDIDGNLSIEEFRQKCVELAPQAMAILPRKGLAIQWVVQSVLSDHVMMRPEFPTIVQHQNAIMKLLPGMSVIREHYVQAMGVFQDLLLDVLDLCHCSIDRSDFH